MTVRPVALAIFPLHPSATRMLRFGPALCLLVLLSGCGGSAPLVESSRADATIDGKAEDWSGGLRLVDGERGLSLGLRNDDDALYSVVVVRDRFKALQILRGGLTVWIDPLGGDAKTVGFRFPVGGGPAGPDAEGPGRRGQRDPEAVRAMLRERAAVAFAEVEFLTDGADEGMREAAAAQGGFAVAGAFDQGELVLEMRVPLRSADAPISVGAAPGATVGIQMSTPEAPQRRPDFDDRQGRDGRGDIGRAGGRQGSRAGRGPQRARPRPGALEPVGIELRVTLAG